MREIKKIIIHCSDSEFGDVELIDKWHKERGWKGIGYHYVILNGCRVQNIYNILDDGLIESGRDLEGIGAHCEGQNEDSIGICLIGKKHFSAYQLYTALPVLLKRLIRQFDIQIPPSPYPSPARGEGIKINLGVYGHYEFNNQKTCPNIDMETLRRVLSNL